jgi:predicted SAM-dependent methyltransferase
MLSLLNLMFREFRKTVRSSIIKRKGIKRATLLKGKDENVRLDLGCGSSKKPCFVGLDFSPDADIQWDIRWGLPFDDNSVIEIRSDHFLEHLELPMVVEVLRECRRVLVLGGVLNFTVPHINPYLDAYRRSDFKLLKEKIFDVPKEQEDLYNTCFDRISWLLYRSGEHKSLFDRESILAKVKLAGFASVTTREFDEIKDTNFRFSSIYVVAVK